MGCRGLWRRGLSGVPFGRIFFGVLRRVLEPGFGGDRLGSVFLICRVFFFRGSMGDSMIGGALWRGLCSGPWSTL